MRIRRMDERQRLTPLAARRWIRNARTNGPGGQVWSQIKGNGCRYSGFAVSHAQVLWRIA